MPKPRRMGIFGRNLLDEPEQVPGYDALLEYQDHKPFECVGEGRESRAAMAALSRRPEWKEGAIVNRFTRALLPQLGAGDTDVAPLLVTDHIEARDQTNGQKVGREIGWQYVIHPGVAV